MRSAKQSCCGPATPARPAGPTTVGAFHAPGLWPRWTRKSQRPRIILEPTNPTLSQGGREGLWRFSAPACRGNARHNLAKAACSSDQAGLGAVSTRECGRRGATRTGRRCSRQDTDQPGFSSGFVYPPASARIFAFGFDLRTCLLGLPRANLGMTMLYVLGQRKREV